MASRVLTVNENLQSVSPQRAAELMERDGYVRTRLGQPQPSTTPDQRLHGSATITCCPPSRLTRGIEMAVNCKSLSSQAERALALFPSVSLQSCLP